MHDITEGGVLGAVWEASKAIGKGIKVYESLIPVKDVTKEIADIVGIDLYRLISSGSMLIIGEEKNVLRIYEELDANNIKATVIGEIIEEGILMERNGEVSIIEPPASDELYKALLFDK